MTMRQKIAVKCECGHTGVVHWSENDQPYSKAWEKYTLEGFKGSEFYTEGPVALSEALKEMQPQCPRCGEKGKIIMPKAS